MNARRAILIFFFFFLLFPYFILFFKFPIAGSLDWGEVGWALKNTVWQAGLSALGTLFFGVWLGLGFLKIQRNFYLSFRMIRAFEILLLLPSFLPPLFILLVVLSLVSPFPSGLTGVVLIHSFMNAGLVALVFKRLVESKLLPLVELSWVEGATQWQFLRASWGMLRRDLYGILLFVFALCFTSFSIPLIAGGGRATTLEILIYEKLRISNAWSEAFSLSLIQLGAILIFSMLPFSPRKKLFGRSLRIPLLGSWSGLVLFGIYCLGIPAYFAFQSFIGWDQVIQIPGLWSEALALLPLSFLFALTVGLLVGALLLLVARAFPSMGLHRLISGVVSPSTALLGFSLLFFLSQEEPWNYMKWVLGFTYLIFATLYRWGWDQELSGLSDQVQAARTLGADSDLIFRDILFPQLLTPLVRISSVASLWALGDFALGRILISQNVTLALLIETLMSSYRLPAALALMGLLLLLGAFCFLFFWGLGYVGRRAFE